jgi:hypothetical protein
MNIDQQITEALGSDEFETVDATESTQGRAGGSMLEIGAWVYER